MKNIFKKLICSGLSFAMIFTLLSFNSSATYSKNNVNIEQNAELIHKTSDQLAGVMDAIYQEPSAYGSQIKNYQTHILVNNSKLPI